MFAWRGARLGDDIVDTPDWIMHIAAALLFGN